MGVVNCCLAGGAMPAGSTINGGNIRGNIPFPPENELLYNNKTKLLSQEKNPNHLAGSGLRVIITDITEKQFS
jgi:hypothetical protein